MLTPYIQAAGQALAGLLDLLVRLALPLSIGLGLAVVAGALLLYARRDSEGVRAFDWRSAAALGFGYLAVGLLLVAGWAVLGRITPLARENIEWKETAESTARPEPDAPDVYQFAPVAAALTERTYTRTLTLPPDFVQRLGTEGLGVLSPYLTDPTAENVLRLADTFRRSGQDVLFTRALTRLDEEPIPLDSSRVKTHFRRLAGRAYELEFEGRYAFRNSGVDPIKARFLISLPQAGTIQGLDIRVGTEPIQEPNAQSAYEWNGELKPGEQREAVVRYRVRGGGTWHYDLGSRRRRVKEFSLEAVPGGLVRFPRGSLEPTRTAGGTLHWELTDVVTAQQIALAFPRDIAARDSYLQALSALPLALLLFLVGTALLRPASLYDPARLLLGLALFGLGLGAAAVLAEYIGPIPAVLLCPVAGSVLAAAVLGRKSLFAGVPAALLPAVFLSPEHSGLLLLFLVVAALLAMRHFRVLPPPRSPASA